MQRVMSSMLLLAALLVCNTNVASAQNNSVRIDALAACSGTIGFGVDVAMANKWSADICGYINPISNERISMKHHMAQLGTKYWLFGVSAGHFIGQHLIYVGYDVGKGDNRYVGSGYGGGLSYGHSWIIATRFGIAAEVGVGVLRCSDVKSPAHESYTITQYKHHTKRLLVMPTRVSLTANYLF